MKKCLILVLAAFLAVTVSTQAQGKKLYFGPKAGLNITGITSTNMDTWRIGANVGGFAMYKFNNFVAVQGDLLFSMMGANYDVGNVRLNYLAIPVVAKVYMIDRLSIQLGPQIGFRVYDHVSGMDLGVKGSELFNGVDVSFLVGLGYEFDMGLMVDFRYGVGLTNPVKSSYNDGDGSSNQLFQFSVGWMF